MWGEPQSLRVTPSHSESFRSKFRAGLREPFCTQSIAHARHTGSAASRVSVLPAGASRAAASRVSVLPPAESRPVLPAAAPSPRQASESRGHRDPPLPSPESSCSGNRLGAEGATALSSGLTALTNLQSIILW